MMKIYCGNNGSLEIFEMMKRNGWGNVHLADHWRWPKEGIDWILDNGAYSAFVNNLQFNEIAFMKALDNIEMCCSYPDFIVTPDIVAGGYVSLDFSLQWINKIPTGYNCYLAVQDGMAYNIISDYCGLFDGLFIGGTLEWKLKTGSVWVKLAHKHNIKCHIGKAGTFKRLVWAKSIGADSIDSSSFVQAKPGTGFRRIHAAVNQSTLTERVL